MGLVAVAALLARRADGESFLPTWLACAAQLPLLIGWLKSRLRSTATPPSSEGRRRVADGCLAILVLIGAAAAAVIHRDCTLCFLATTSFVCGCLLVEALSSVFRRAEACTTKPGEMFKLLIKPWLVLVLISTVLLAIPLATLSGVPDYRHNFWLHVLNGAHAAVGSACLVGTTVYCFGQEYTLFGQAVLLVTTLLAGMAFAAIGLAIVQPFLQRVLRLKTVLALSFAAQAAGILVMWNCWSDADAPGSWDRFWWGLVHSSGAMWNTSLTLRPNGLFSYIQSGPIFATITTLSIAGSIGMPVILDLLLGLRTPKAGAPGSRTPALEPSVSSIPWRRVPSWEAAFAFLLLLAGACLLFVFEAPWRSEVVWSIPESWVPQRPLVFGEGRASLRDGMPAGIRWTLGVFISSTLRSAGLQSVSLSEGALSWPSYGLVLLWMAVGGGVGGVAGGLRATVLSVLAVCLFSRKRTWAAHPGGLAVRRLLGRSVFQLLLLSALLNAAAVGALRWSSGAAPYDIVFEAVAAANSVGLSTGLSMHLTWLGHIVIIVVMIAGRLLPIICWLSVSRGITACLRCREGGTSGNPQ